jgi:predicted DNA-binding transcriptional regulator AlpA
LPVSAMSIWRFEQQGILPQHITIGGRSFWRLKDVLEAIERIESGADKRTSSRAQ